MRTRLKTVKHNVGRLTGAYVMLYKPIMASQALGRILDVKPDDENKICSAASLAGDEKSEAVLGGGAGGCVFRVRCGDELLAVKILWVLEDEEVEVTREIL